MNFRPGIMFTMFPLLCGCMNQQKISNEIFDDYEKINLNEKARGTKYALNFEVGESHKNPSFVVWLETMNGKYIQTLYITKSYGTGLFARADAGDGTLLDAPGLSIRPAGLPYWSHRRGILNEWNNYAPSPETPVMDTYTGATPSCNFLVVTKADKMINGNYRLMVEVNQPWDANEYWTDDKYPDDLDYKSSCQPSLLYAVNIPSDHGNEEYYLKPIGHGQYSGKDGSLNADLSTLTTALNIFKSISVMVK